MKESYGEGLASHTGPELCAEPGNGLGEALAGGHVRSVLSSEKTVFPSATTIVLAGRQHATAHEWRGLL